MFRQAIWPPADAGGSDLFTKSAKISSRCERLRILAAFIADQRQNLVDDITVIARQHLDLPSWMRLAVQQTIFVDRIDRIRAYFSVLDEILDRIDEMKSFVFQVI